MGFGMKNRIYTTLQDNQWNITVSMGTLVVAGNISMVKYNIVNRGTG